MTKVVCHKPSNKLDNILFITQFYLVLKLIQKLNKYNPSPYSKYWKNLYK
jgi:hypothetical protein